MSIKHIKDKLQTENIYKSDVQQDISTSYSEPSKKIKNKKSSVLKLYIETANGKYTQK